MDELAGPVGVDPPDDPAGRAVHPGDTVHAGRGEDLVDGGCWHIHDAGDPGGPELAPPAEPKDLQLDPGWGAVRATPGSARPVLEASWALVLEPLPPLGSRLARDAHLGGHMGDGTARGDPIDQHHPAADGQGRVSVHVSLLGFVGC